MHPVHPPEPGKRDIFVDGLRSDGNSSRGVARISLLLGANGLLELVVPRVTRETWLGGRGCQKPQYTGTNKARNAQLLSLLDSDNGGSTDRWLTLQWSISMHFEPSPDVGRTELSLSGSYTPRTQMSSIYAPWCPWTEGAAIEESREGAPSKGHQSTSRGGTRVSASCQTSAFSSEYDRQLYAISQSVSIRLPGRQEMSIAVRPMASMSQ